MSGNKPTDKNYLLTQLKNFKTTILDPIFNKKKDFYETTEANLDTVVASSNVGDLIITSDGTTSGSSINIVDNLTSTSTVDALSAKQGKVLKDLIDDIDVPTKTSDLTNDGDGTNAFLTQHQSLSAYRTSSAQDVIDATKASVSDLEDLEETVCGIAGGDAYSSTTTYAVGDIVIYNNALYKCIATCVGIVPTNTSYWEVISVKTLNSKYFASRCVGSNSESFTAGTEKSFTTTFDNPAGVYVISYNIVCECNAGQHRFNNIYMNYNATTVKERIYNGGVDALPATSFSTIARLNANALVGLTADPTFTNSTYFESAIKIVKISD